MLDKLLLLCILFIYTKVLFCHYGGDTMKDVIVLENEKLKNDILKLESNYSGDLKLFVNFLNEKGLSINIESVKKYIESLEEGYLTVKGEKREYAVETYNRKISAVKRGIRYLFEKSPASFDMNKKYRLEETLKQIKLKKRNSKAVNRDLLLSPEEVKKLIKRASEKLGLMIEFLYASALRVSEMTNAKVSNIKNFKQYYEIRIIGKGNKERKIKIKKGLIIKIKNHVKSEEYLFETLAGKRYDRRYITMQIKRLGRRILGKNISAHTLRHSFATNMLKKGHSIKAISQYLGHSSVALTLDLYTHDSLEWDSLEDLIEEIEE